jgi:hypothetical protein
MALKFELKSLSGEVLIKNLPNKIKIATREINFGLKTTHIYYIIIYKVEWSNRTLPGDELTLGGVELILCSGPVCAPILAIQLAFMNNGKCIEHRFFKILENSQHKIYVLKIKFLECTHSNFERLGTQIIELIQHSLV